MTNDTMTEAPALTTEQRQAIAFIRIRAYMTRGDVGEYLRRWAMTTGDAQLIDMVNLLDATLDDMRARCRQLEAGL